jgi:hypothetical protein
MYCWSSHLAVHCSWYTCRQNSAEIEFWQTGWLARRRGSEKIHWKSGSFALPGLRKLEPVRARLPACIFESIRNSHLESWPHGQEYAIWHIGLCTWYRHACTCLWHYVQVFNGMYRDMLCTCTLINIYLHTCTWILPYRCTIMMYIHVHEFMSLYVHVTDMYIDVDICWTRPGGNSGHQGCPAVLHLCLSVDHENLLRQLFIPCIYIVHTWYIYGSYIDLLCTCALIIQCLYHCQWGKVPLWTRL